MISIMGMQLARFMRGLPFPACVPAGTAFRSLFFRFQHAARLPDFFDLFRRQQAVHSAVPFQFQEFNAEFQQLDQLVVFLF